MGKSSSGRNKSLGTALSQVRTPQTHHPVTALGKDSHARQQSYPEGYSTSTNFLRQNKLSIFMQQLGRTPHRAPPATSAGFGLKINRLGDCIKRSIQGAGSVPCPAGEQHRFACTLQRGLPAWSPSSCHPPALLYHQGPPPACRKRRSRREKQQAEPKHTGISEA